MTIGHRLAIQPMEGWDCERDGTPSENTKRRWRRFGLSGAKLIWGGEACAVRLDGRANPKQLTMTERQPGRHRGACATSSSPRTRKRPATTTTWSSACSSRIRAASASRTTTRKFESIIAYNHPLLDRKFGYPADRPVISDDEIKRLIEDYVVAAKRARGMRLRFRRRQALPRLSRPRIPQRRRPARALRRQPRKPHPLPARDRRRHPRRSAAAARSACGLAPSTPCRSSPIPRVRCPARSAPASRKTTPLPYRYAFGGNPDNPLEYDLTEPKALFEILRELGRAASSTSRRRAPTTTRISSGRRSIRRPTAIIRPRIRSSA